MKKRKVDLANKLYDELDSEVTAVFQEYVSIMGYSYAYGVERWYPNDDMIHITQDTSCRGCYNCEYHELPTKWLYLEGDDRTEAIQQHRDEKLLKRQREEALALEAEEKRRRQQYEKLKQEFEGKP